MLTSHVQSLVCYDPETFLKVFCRRQACLRVIHHDIVSHNCLCPKIVTASLRPCIQGPHVCVCVEVAGMQAFVWYLCQWLLDLCLGKGFSFCFFFFSLGSEKLPWGQIPHLPVWKKHGGGIMMAEVEQSCPAPTQAVVEHTKLGRGRHQMSPAQLLHLPHPLCCALPWGRGQCWTSHWVFFCCWNCSMKLLPSQDGAGAILYPILETGISRILGVFLFQWVGEV